MEISAPTAAAIKRLDAICEYTGHSKKVAGQIVNERGVTDTRPLSEIIEEVATEILRAWIGPDAFDESIDRRKSRSKKADNG